MDYVGEAEQLLLGRKGQTEVPYSTDVTERMAAAQVLALLALVKAIRDLKQGE